jgi:hypothetical protein
MKNIESMVGRELQWVQPSFFKRMYELRSGDIVVAKMEWAKFLGMAVKAESADGCWMFDQKGLWKSQITAKKCDQDEALMTVEEERFKRTQKLTLSDGRHVTLKSNFWRTTFTLETDTHEPMAIVRKHGLFSTKFDVELRRKGTSFREFPWLVLLMWYLVLVAIRRARAHAATAG